MLGLTHRRFAVIAAVLSVLVLASCSNDPIVSAARPTKEDMANQPMPAPAGTIPALMRMGEATRQAGNPKDALAYFRRAHQIDIFAPLPLVKIGVTLNDLGQYNEAAEVFKDAIALDHNNTEALRGLGAALIGVNQPALAIENLKAALEIEADHRTYNALGVASDHLGDHDTAQKYYDEGLKIFPNNLTLLNNLGLSQILSGNLEAATASLVTAAQLPGAGARQRQNLALAYGLAGHDQEAARILRLDLDNQAIQANLAYYGILRAADNAALMAAVMGVHVPATAPAPPPVQSSELPADADNSDLQPANGPDDGGAPANAGGEDAPSISIVPEAGPDEEATKPGAMAVPPQMSPSVVELTTRPVGGSYQSKQIKDFSQEPESKPQDLSAVAPEAGTPAAVSPRPAAKVETAKLAPAETATEEPTETREPAGDTAQAVAAAAEPTETGSAPPATVPPRRQAEVLRTVAVVNLAQDSAEAAPVVPVVNLANAESAAQSAQADQAAPPPVTTGYSDLAPLTIEPVAAAASAEAVAAGRTTPFMAASPGPPIWYAQAEPLPPSERGRNFFKAIVTFLFGSDRPKAPQPTAVAIAAPAVSASVAAIQPAAGEPLLGAAAASDSAFDLRQDLTARYLQRLDSVRGADPPPGTGLPNAAAP